MIDCYSRHVSDILLYTYYYLNTFLNMRKLWKKNLFCLACSDFEQLFIYFLLLLVVGCMHDTEPGADICTDGTFHIRGDYSLVIFFLKHIKVNVLGIRWIYFVKIVNIRRFYNTYYIYIFIQLHRGVKFY